MEDFTTQRARIDSELGIARAQSRDLADTIEHFDVEAAVNEARDILREPAKVWLELKDVEYKRQFYSGVLSSPTAYHPGEGVYGTPKWSHVYRLSEASTASKKYDVAGVGLGHG